MSEAIGAVAGGPKVFAVRRCEIDLRPGGKMHYCLRTPDGNESAAVDAFLGAP